MDVDLFYGVQRVAIEVSGRAVGLENERFQPMGRQFLLPDERQIYDSPFLQMYPKNLKVADHLGRICTDAEDDVRSLRTERGVRCSNRDPLSLEDVYREIEGDSYVPAISHDDIDVLNGWLNLLQGLEELQDIITMYPELATREIRERWLQRLNELCEMITDSRGFDTPGKDWR